METKYKNLLVYTLLSVIVIVGFIFRLQGIVDNHSFWSDEAYVATLGRDIVTGKRTPFEAMSLLNYQPLHVLTTAVSMKVFGFNEFAARIPVVLFGTLGIVAAFLLARKLSDSYGGLLAAFLYTISQLNLANSTQAKPNTAIQTILLFNLYLLTKLDKNIHNIYLHTLIIALACTATLFHFLGILTFIPYLLFVAKNITLKKPKINTRNICIFLVFSALLLFVFFFTSGKTRFENLFSPTNLNNFIYLHNISLLRELLWKNYAFITLPALFGLIISYKSKNNTVTSLVITYAVSLIFFWIFYAFRNVRYILPIFGLLFVYFAVFWSHIGKKILNNGSFLACFLVAMFIYMGGYKIVRTPGYYYNPNGDLYGDVQIADYKTTFQLIKKYYPNLSDIAIFNDWHETQYWYMPEKIPDAYFIVNTKKPFPSKTDGSMVYGTLENFLNEKSKYTKGILIVEDWDSLLPDDIKNYAKKNLKREFRVESLPQAKNDPWPIEIYSWKTSEIKY